MDAALLELAEGVCVDLGIGEEMPGDDEIPDLVPWEDDSDNELPLAPGTIPRSIYASIFL
jgi:hypothetical protein